VRGCPIVKIETIRDRIVPLSLVDTNYEWIVQGFARSKHVASSWLRCENRMSATSIYLNNFNRI